MLVSNCACWSSFLKFHSKNEVIKLLKSMKSIGVLALAAVMVALCISAVPPTNAYASESNHTPPVVADSSAATAVAQSIYLGPIELDDVYRQLYTNRATGINANVEVQTYNIFGAHQTDIQMADANGNVVWEEAGAISPGGARTFWCGPEVVTIRARISCSNPLGYLQPRVGFCEVRIG